MSEEHPASPSKFINTKHSVGTLETSKIITYRPLKSVCDSEISMADGDRAILGNDSDSGRLNESKSSFQQLNSNLYRYVTSVGTHQIETSN